MLIFDPSTVFDTLETHSWLLFLDITPLCPPTSLPAPGFSFLDPPWLPPQNIGVSWGAVFIRPVLWLCTHFVRRWLYGLDYISVPRTPSVYLQHLPLFPAPTVYPHLIGDSKLTRFTQNTWFHLASPLQTSCSALPLSKGQHTVGAHYSGVLGRPHPSLILTLAFLSSPGIYTVSNPCRLCPHSVSLL